MEPAQRKHKKILMLFLFGITLPSALLGYFALRGIQNDQALLEKERLDAQRRIAETVIASVQKRILEAEQALSDLLPGISGARGGTDATLIAYKKRYPLVEEVFLIAPEPELHLLSGKLLYRPLPQGQMQHPVDVMPPKALQEGIYYEFQQHNLKGALDAYRKGLTYAADLQTKGTIYSAIARVQTKAGAFEDAVQTYREILRAYDQVRLAEDTPLGPAAHLELGKLLLKLGRRSHAIETLLDAYQALGEGRWPLTKSQYTFFSDRIRARIGDHLTALAAGESDGYRNRFRELQAVERHRSEATEKFLQLCARSSDLQAGASHELEIRTQTSARFLFDAGGNRYLISALRPEKGFDKSRQIYGLIFSPDYLKDQLLRPALLQNSGSRTMPWLIKARDGEILIRSEAYSRPSLAFSRTFPEDFPPWVIEFHHPDDPLLQTLVTSPRFYIFLLLGGILTFGLILTIRSVGHELDLARMKSEFVSTVSHEFKSPLTSIRQISEMLRNRRVPSEERQQRYFDALVEQTERLSLLIENVLDFARMEEGRKRFEFEPTDIGSWLSDIVAVAQERVAHEGRVIRLTLKEPLPQITADRAALAQAVHNLIDNAIKYSAGAKEVRVGAHMEAGNLVIEVQDFGVGISPEEIGRVFDRFYRGKDPRIRTIRGSGLGLTLVKQIVEAHGGTVQIRSEPGKGSTFSIRLPLKKEE